MSELKCCPFCGGEATLERDQKDDFVEWSIYCYNRGCVCSAHTYCYDNKDDAIRDWNTRTPMANIVEKLEEKTEFLKDCTKYGNENAEQQEKSYSTMMMYEVAGLVDDLIDIVKQEINNGLE